MPVPGESMLAEHLTLEAGGKGLNLALAATRLGMPANVLFAIGTDVFADFARTSLADFGLTHAMLHQLPGATGMGVGFTDSNGECQVAIHPGANALLGRPQVREVEAAIRSAKLVLAQFEVADDPIEEAFGIARRAGVRTLLNPSPFRRPDGDILRNTSILILNRVEAGLASSPSGPRPGTREEAEAAATSLLAEGPDVAVVTLGADGAVACQRGGSPVFQPAYPVDVVSTLGAGDAFAAAFAAATVEGRPLGEVLQRASACGALTCMRDGVAETLPTSTTLERFLAANDVG